MTSDGMWMEGNRNAFDWKEEVASQRRFEVFGFYEVCRAKQPAVTGNRLKTEI